ncbi:putative sugar nucleotidyl transferase [Dyadobacter tibetensis]|uniref:putative sugar nucleotidyl transferase n=1 Tax=Dyadobacter tibetensis TaxID=1211851 RepID=UPI00046EA016|nr:putative sugar nucleotidyl transferase [Dyadobacter tibetensis]
MPDIVFFDDHTLRLQLRPFTFTRPIAALRCGIQTIAEKWALRIQGSVFYLTEDYLQDKFKAAPAGLQLHINGALCPNEALVEAIINLSAGQKLHSNEGELLAYYADGRNDLANLKMIPYPGPFTMIRHPWELFLYNGAQIVEDYRFLITGRQSSEINDPFTRCYAPENIFVEPGADIKAAILNAENGPIYIGRNTLVQEGASIQGPFAMGEGSTVAQGAKIRPNTTIGPYCKVGGEVSNSVILGYSNKGHDGYLGNSVLGEWCNLGANTNNSNLKNDHSTVSIYSYKSGGLADTGLVNCGLMMGDYSKSGISTMFNTGTVVGVNVNVFGAGFQPKYIPSFSWGGGAEGFALYRLHKALIVAKDTCQRRNVIFGEQEEQILTRIFEMARSEQELAQS